MTHNILKRAKIKDVYAHMSGGYCYINGTVVEHPDHPPGSFISIQKVLVAQHEDGQLKSFQSWNTEYKVVY
jgi:hypothetical protein